LILFPIPILNVSQYDSMLGSSFPSIYQVKIGSSNAVEPFLKKFRKSYDNYRVFQDT
jgi:hypothetical protein